MQQFIDKFLMGWGLPASFIVIMILVIIFKRPINDKLKKGSEGTTGKVSKVIFLALGLPLLVVGIIMSLAQNSYAPILGIPLGLLGLALTIASLSIDHSVPKK